MEPISLDIRYLNWIIFCQKCDNLKEDYPTSELMNDYLDVYKKFNEYCDEFYVNGVFNVNNKKSAKVYYIDYLNKIEIEDYEGLIGYNLIN